MKRPNNNNDRKTTKKEPFALLDVMVDDMASQHQETLDRLSKAVQRRRPWQGQTTK